jgi:hypothetical protein
MRASIRRSVILGVVAFATLASSALALPLSQVWFPNEANRLIGDPRRGTDEIYQNSPGVTYLTPANILGGAAVLPGQVPGQIESLRNVAGTGYIGINIPQPCNVAGVASDPRNVLVNPTTNPPYAAAGGMWGVRAGAAVQWQSVQDGATQLLTPSGVNSGQAYNLTPNNLFNTAFGLDPGGIPTAVAPVDVGGAPGSFAGDGVADFIPWVRNIADPNQLTTGYGINAWDAGAIHDYFDPASPKFNPAAFGGAPEALVNAILDARVDLWEGGALFDQVTGSFDARNFNMSGGTNGIVGDELNDAVDGTLLLTGTLSNIQITNTWTAQILKDALGNPVLVGGLFVADPTKPVQRTIKIVADITYDGGTLLPWLKPDPVTGLKTGVISANYNSIPFTNVDTVTKGTHPDIAAYDFVGNKLTSYDASQTFQTIPEPLTMASGILALCGLGGYAQRRRLRGA